ncbi:MAG: hypothetical protein ACFFD2_01975 [Promethearchaeota archaeon]
MVYILSTKFFKKGHYLIFGLLLSVCTPFFSSYSYTIADYYDIIYREKKVKLDWNEQIGMEYILMYENLFLDVTVVENEGPLQGYLQTEITYDNSKTDGQTSFNFNLERINFFIDLNGDQCQSWTAYLLNSTYILVDIDNLICSFAPISSISWIKNNTEYDRHYGVKNFNFIWFYETLTEYGSILNWGIEETLVFALKYDKIIFWDYNITLNFRLLFHFTNDNGIAYLQHEVYIENCSINKWIELFYNFTSINLALEWNSDVSVTNGLVSSPAVWSLNDQIIECSTAYNITNSKILENGKSIGQLNLGTTYVENDAAIYPLLTSAIPLQLFTRDQAEADSTQLRYSQTIPNYLTSDISFSSQFEFYCASTTLNIIFIILFNIILSIIFIKKGVNIKGRIES